MTIWRGLLFGPVQRRVTNYCALAIHAFVGSSMLRDSGSRKTECRANSATRTMGVFGAEQTSKKPLLRFANKGIKIYTVQIVGLPI
jgi:hypothetical protein